MEGLPILQTLQAVNSCACSSMDIRGHAVRGNSRIQVKIMTFIIWKWDKKPLPNTIISESHAQAISVARGNYLTWIPHDASLICACTVGVCFLLGGVFPVIFSCVSVDNNVRLLQKKKLFHFENPILNTVIQHKLKGHLLLRCCALILYTQRIKDGVRGEQPGKWDCGGSERSTCEQSTGRSNTGYWAVTYYSLGTLVT